MTARLGFILLPLLSILRVVAQDITFPGIFFYGCFGATPSGPNEAPLRYCPLPPVTYLTAEFFYTKCVCNVLQHDASGLQFVYCTSFESPSSQTFSGLCTTTQLQTEDTCDNIQDIRDWSNRGCSGISTASQLTGVLCSNKSPVGKAKNILGKFGIGRVLVGLLDVGCALSPSLHDARIMCNGLDALAAGCTAADIADSVDGEGKNTPKYLYWMFGLSFAVAMRVIMNYLV